MSIHTGQAGNTPHNRKRRFRMGMTLGDILQELKDFRNSADYFLQCIGYTATDIDNLIGDLELKLREADAQR